ncbi:MAG: MBL fold metallo-hydrolase [Oscillospiraceae bacterium]|nr:MBL fold metallo-hydrolase [Oscillospiraceae bacterium]
MLTVKKIILGEIETNTYVLESDAVCAVIDPAIESRELSDFLKGKSVKYILLTHGHFDHIAGVDSIVRETGAKVCIHTLDNEMLCDGNKSLYNSNLGGIQPHIKADMLLNDGDEITLGETVIRVMHTPGHTNGSVCYILQNERIIFSGDTLFRLTAGRTDLAGIEPIIAGRNELKSLQKIANLAGDFRVLPGHNEETTLQFERENNKYMRKKYASFG